MWWFLFAFATMVVFVSAVFKRNPTLNPDHFEIVTDTEANADKTKQS